MSKHSSIQPQTHDRGAAPYRAQAFLWEQNKRCILTLRELTAQQERPTDNKAAIQGGAAEETAEAELRTTRSLFAKGFRKGFT